MMSFMGSIGSMMIGSGLEEALETVYGPNAVTHMMSGKAFSKALREHWLVESALVNKLMISVLPCKLNGGDSFECTELSEMSMDTLEMVKDDQCSSSVMEIETSLNNNDVFTAIATPVREVETDTNLNCGTETTENLQDSLIEVEIPAAETEIDMYEDKLNAAEVRT